MSHSRQSIPTLGYPSQKAAIIALYEERVEPKAIADMVICTINVVHRSIHDYRAKTGRIIAPIRGLPRAIPIQKEAWPDSSYQRAVEAHRRAVEGARRTLAEGAAGA